jgi:RNA recognition motif-containing protein
MQELRLTDNTQIAISDNFPLTPEALAKLNFALSLTGTTHAVESLQTHCELSVEDAETLAVALHLLSKVNFTESMINKPRRDVAQGSQSTTTLYIRNLPLNVTMDELQVAFENYGIVKEIRTQKEKLTGEFFGSVFVEYVHASAATLAHVQMDGKLWGINTLHVSFAKEKTQTLGGGSSQPAEMPLQNLSAHAQYQPPLIPHVPSISSVGLGGGLGLGGLGGLGSIGGAVGGGGNANSASIFISGLAPETDVSEVKSLFHRFGEIADARLLTDKATGLPKGVAFVDFVLPVSAAAAIDSINNQIHNGRNLKVSFATQKSKSGSTPQAASALPSYGAPFPTGAYPEYGMSYPSMHSFY